MSEHESPNTLGRKDSAIEAQILEAVRSLRFGSVEVTVHEGRVVQIDRRERTRMTDKRS